MLIAVLATDNLSLTEKLAAALADAALRSGGSHPFGRTMKFKDALSAVLTQQGLCRLIEEVRVSRTAGRATIRFKKNAKYDLAEFQFAAARSGIEIEATVGTDTLNKIGADVRAIIEAAFAEADEE